MLLLEPEHLDLGDHRDSSNLRQRCVGELRLLCRQNTGEFVANGVTRSGPVTDFSQAAILIGR